MQTVAATAVAMDTESVIVVSFIQVDKASGQVRQVENEDSNQRAASSPSNNSTAQHSTSATSYRSGGNVNRVAFSDSSMIIEDLKLTEFSLQLQLTVPFA